MRCKACNKIMTPVWNNQLQIWDVCSECRAIALRGDTSNVDENGRFELNITKKRVGSLGVGNTDKLASDDDYPTEAHEVKDFLDYMLEDIDNTSVSDLVGYDVTKGTSSDGIEGN